MASSRDPGTPLGGERAFSNQLRDVRQRLFSPVPDNIDIATPETPADASVEQVTLSAIAGLLDLKLGPVKADIENLSQEMTGFKAEVLDRLEKAEGRLNTTDVKIAKLEEFMQQGSEPANQYHWNKIVAL